DGFLARVGGILLCHVLSFRRTSRSAESLTLPPILVSGLTIDKGRRPPADVKRMSSHYTL
ncbi:hypothetical protein K1Y78_58590, partial [Streptomyces sp. tea 10]|nr:hypothetical protein [Streptomyces sp. tea 10]